MAGHASDRKLKHFKDGRRCRPSCFIWICIVYYLYRIENNLLLNVIASSLSGNSVRLQSLYNVISPITEH